MARRIQRNGLQYVSYYFSILICTLSAKSYSAGNLKIFDELQKRTQEQCQKFYPLQFNEDKYIERLKNAAINEKDKLACAFPYVWTQIQKRLGEFEALDPMTTWQNQAYVTLAARIYNFDFLDDTPNGEKKIEIMSIHPDLLILHRILRQVTPYALALVFPQIGKNSVQFVRELRKSAASASEITPWSSYLRQALGVDCFGPHASDCRGQRRESFAVLKAGVGLLKEKENLYGYVAGFSKTQEATGALFNNVIQVAQGVRSSLNGQGPDFIMGPPVSTGWKQLTPDLRDTLNYLDSHSKDSEAPSDKMILMDQLSCKTIYRILSGLAREENNSIQSEFSSLNPMQTVHRENPNLILDHLAFENFINSKDCSELAHVRREFSYRGFLSRFQRYQAQILLLSSHDGGLAYSDYQKQLMKRFTLLKDIESVVSQFEKIESSYTDVTPNAQQVTEAQSLLDYAIQITRENP